MNVRTRKPKKKPVARRSKPTVEELAAIEPTPPREDILSRSAGASDGVKFARLFRLFIDSEDSPDYHEYHQIINDPDRFVILDQDQTWDKDKGSTVGITVFLFYVDRFAGPK